MYVTVCSMSLWRCALSNTFGIFRGGAVYVCDYTQNESSAKEGCVGELSVT
jgi:hypothetical protein